MVKALEFGSSSFPTCVALNKSALETLKLEVYVPSLLTECSCDNNKSVTDTKPCTTQFNNHAHALLGVDLGHGINWECKFGVQTKELPDPSTCKRFQ